jgi:hypothetical protein
MRGRHDNPLTTNIPSGNTRRRRRSDRRSDHPDTGSRIADRLLIQPTLSVRSFHSASIPGCVFNCWMSRVQSRRKRWLL